MGVSKDKKDNSTNGEVSTKQTEQKTHRKGGASAGRQRFKKGKT